MQAPANTLALRPDPTAVASALQWLEGIAEREGWPPRASFGLTLCLDEALTNVISYAFDPPEPGIEPAITVSWRNDRAGIVVELRDNGRPYDPTAAEPPPLAANLDEAKLGGHGVRLMRHYLQELAYRREDGWNCLTMVMAAAPARDQGAAS